MTKGNITKFFGRKPTASSRGNFKKQGEWAMQIYREIYNDNENNKKSQRMVLQLEKGEKINADILKNIKEIIKNNNGKVRISSPEIPKETECICEMDEDEKYTLTFSSDRNSEKYSTINLANLISNTPNTNIADNLNIEIYPNKTQTIKMNHSDIAHTKIYHSPNAIEIMDTNQSLESEVSDIQEMLRKTGKYLQTPRIILHGYEQPGVEKIKSIIKNDIDLQYKSKQKEVENGSQPENYIDHNKLKDVTKKHQKMLKDIYTYVITVNEKILRKKN